MFPDKPSITDHEHAKKITENALGLLNRILQSHQQILLTEGFNIKATILRKKHIDYKRKRGTLREPELIH